MLSIADKELTNNYQDPAETKEMLSILIEEADWIGDELPNAPLIMSACMAALKTADEDGNGARYDKLMVAQQGKAKKAGASGKQTKDSSLKVLTKEQHETVEWSAWTVTSIARRAMGATSTPDSKEVEDLLAVLEAEMVWLPGQIPRMPATWNVCMEALKASNPDRYEPLAKSMLKMAHSNEEHSTAMASPQRRRRHGIPTRHSPRSRKATQGGGKKT